MMYGLAIEEWEQEKDFYRQQLSQIIKAGNFSQRTMTEINTKISMCHKFIEFLKRMEEQETELEEDNQ